MNANELTYYEPVRFTNTSARSCKPIVAEQQSVYDSETSTSASSSVVIVMPFDKSRTATLPIREHSKEYIRLLEEASWTATFFQTAPSLNDSKSLLPYYKEINKLLIQEQYELCDIFLNQVKTQELSDTLLVGLLRLTSNWKSKLPSWSHLLVKARKELDNRNYKSEDLLKGLS